MIEWLALAVAGAALGVDAGDPAKAVKARIRAARALGNPVRLTVEELRTLPSLEAFRIVRRLVVQHAKKALAANPRPPFLSRETPVGHRLNVLTFDAELAEICMTYNLSNRWPAPYIVAGEGIPNGWYHPSMGVVPAVSAHRLEIRKIVWNPDEDRINVDPTPLSIQQAQQRGWLTVKPQPRPLEPSCAIFLVQQDLLTGQRKDELLVDLSGHLSDPFLFAPVATEKTTLQTSLRWAYIALLVSLDHQFGESTRPEVLLDWTRELQEGAPTWQKAAQRIRRSWKSQTSYGADPAPTGLDKIRYDLDQLTKAGKQFVLDEFAKVDKRVESEIKQAIRSAPGELFAFVTDAAVDSAIIAGREDLADDVRRIRLRIDPRDAAEVVKAVGAVQHIVARSPVVRKLTNRVIDLLDEHGILTGGWLGDLITVLAAVAAGAQQVKQFMRGGRIVLSTPYGSVSITKIGEYNTRIKIPLWKNRRRGLVRQALELVAEGQVTADIPVQHVEAGLPTGFALGRGKRTTGTVTPYVSWEAPRRTRSSHREVGVRASARFGVR